MRELRFPHAEKPTASVSVADDDFARVQWTGQRVEFMTADQLWAASEFFKLAFYDLTEQDICVAEAGER